MKKILTIAAAASVTFISANTAFAESTSELSCNDGALEVFVVRSPGENNPNFSYTIQVNDQNVIDFIKGEEGKPVQAIGGGYLQGKLIETSKKLDEKVQFEQTENGEVMVMSRYFYYDTPDGSSWLNGQYKPRVDFDGVGAKLTIDGFEFRGSHSTIKYEYANWYFESCELVEGDISDK